MLEDPDDPTEENWARMSLDACPVCHSHKLVPAVPGWEDVRYCLQCKQVVGGRPDD